MIGIVRKIQIFETFSNPSFWTTIATNAYGQRDCWREKRTPLLPSSGSGLVERLELESVGDSESSRGQE